MFKRNPQEYIEIKSYFTSLVTDSHPIATAIPYTNNQNLESQTPPPQALPVTPSAPLFIFEK